MYFDVQRRRSCTNIIIVEEFISMNNFSVELTDEILFSENVAPPCNVFPKK